MLKKKKPATPEERRVRTMMHTPKLVCRDPDPDQGKNMLINSIGQPERERCEITSSISKA